MDKKKVLVITMNTSFVTLVSKLQTYLEKINYENYDFLFVLKNISQNEMTTIEEDLARINVQKDNIKWFTKNPVKPQLKYSQEEIEVLVEFYKSYVGGFAPDLVITRDFDTSHLEMMFPNALVYNLMEGNMPPTKAPGVLLTPGDNILGLPYLEEHPEKLSSTEFDHPFFKVVAGEKNLRDFFIESKLSPYIDEIRRSYSKVVFFPIDKIGFFGFEKSFLYGNYQQTIQYFCEKIPDDIAVIISFHPLDLKYENTDQIKRIQSYFPSKDNFYFINFDLENFPSPRKISHSLVYLCDHIVVLNSKTVYLAMCYNKPISLLSKQKISFYPHIFSIENIKNIEQQNLSQFPADHLLLWISLYEKFSPTDNQVINEKKFTSFFTQEKMLSLTPLEKEELINYYAVFELRSKIGENYQISVEYSQLYDEYILSVDERDKLTLKFKSLDDKHEVLKRKYQKLTCENSDLYNTHKVLEKKYQKLMQESKKQEKFFQSLSWKVARYTFYWLPRVRRKR